ncbi:MAG TPA: Xaa-Pro peptidase family protein [Thermomicrobiales bacterium]|nr:Xaa-Pro peptidase family protein [Thermomicrobiales bacterium]
MEGTTTVAYGPWETGERLNDRERVVKYGAPATEAPFSQAEYCMRRDRVRDGMRESGIDLLYVMSPEGMCYLSGYANEWYQAQSPKAWAASSGIAVHVDHDRFILFDSAAETILIRTSSIASDVRNPERGSAIEFIVNELKAEGWLTGTVGLEMWSYRPNRVVSERFQAAFESAGCAVTDGSDVIRSARKLKSPQELAYMEIAALIADIGLAAARNTICAGLTELEVYGEVIAAMARAGGENAAITLPVLSGIKTPTGHGLASRKQIMPGEVVLVDVCGVFNRYHVNVARNFAVGEPHPDVSQRINLAAQMFSTVEGILRPHLPISEFNTAVQNYYDEVGLWEHRGYVGGYETGIAFPPDWVGEFNYGPHVDTGNQVFEPGLVVNHEAQFYLPSMVGYCMIIDSIMFTDAEARWLGTTPRELMVIE